MSKLDKYIQMAGDLKMVNARFISPGDIFFDIRAILKCRWGCEDFFNQTIKCNTRNTSYQERIEMIKAYRDISDVLQSKEDVQNRYGFVLIG